VIVIIVFGHEYDGEGIYLATTIDHGNEPRQLLSILESFNIQYACDACPYHVTRKAILFVSIHSFEQNHQVKRSAFSAISVHLSSQSYTLAVGAQAALTRRHWLRRWPWWLLVSVVGVKSTMPTTTKIVGPVSIPV
jgi:hypothetical protein